jgi:quercetin dioxygenase-like cupin family protein
MVKSDIAFVKTTKFSNWKAKYVINKPRTTNELKIPHRKKTSTNQYFKNTTEGKVISTAIAAGEHLKEHLSKVPALLVCVSGNAIYNEDNGTTVELKAGDFVHIEANVQHSIDAWPKFY